MGRRSNRTIGWIVLAVAALLPSFASAASLVDRARLREGPAKDTKLLGWVEAGVTVEIESERNGWYSVHTPDGQSGYVWKDHLRFDAAEPPPTPVVAAMTLVTPTSMPMPGQSPPSTAAPVVELRGAPAGGDPGVAGELQRLRAEIERLATAQQELTQRLARSAHDGSPVPISTDGTAGAAAVFFVVGGFVGWVVGRFTGSRRDRRSRIRL